MVSIQTVLLLILAISVSFAIAVFLEYRRKKREQRKRIATEWKLIREIAADRNLSDVEINLLKRLITSTSPDYPMDVVTVRRHYNECVASFMQTLVGEEEYEQAAVLLRDLRRRLGLHIVPFGQPIESTRELSHNQIIMTVMGDKTAQRWFRLNVTNIDEAWISATARQVKGHDAGTPIEPGSELKCSMWRDDDARYSFQTRVAQYDIGTRTVFLEHTAQMQRHQAREYFRIRHNQPATLALMKPASPDDVVKGEVGLVDTSRLVVVDNRVRGRINSLSAGGLAFETEKSIQGCTHFCTGVDVQEEEPVAVTARIVGMTPLTGGMFLVRGAFVEIDDETRDRIARYVWHKQQPLQTQSHEHITPH